MDFTKMCKNSEKYFSRHPYTNALVHLVGGVGVGILITYPMVGTHPVRWGVTLIALAFIGHVYSYYQK